MAVDQFQGTPGTELLGALQGKDVVFTFIESYGRSAVEDPDYAPQIGALLDAGNAELAAAGFSAQSAWLTSPTAGGGSWLAHSTFQSGVWINNEQRYRSLVSGNRLTLTSAFRRADWQTVAVEPGLTYAWPEGTFYGYDRVYDSHTLGYNGPKASWATMPDQFTLQAFEKLERAKETRPPLMAEITFVSSHTPWAPIPDLVDWDAIGDGSIYGPMTANDPKPSEVWKDDKRVRAEYRRSIEYSVGSLISYVREVRRRRPGDGVPRRPPAGPDRDRHQRQPRRADHHRQQGQGGAGEDGRVGLAGRAEAGPARPGDPDGHLPRPVPDHLQPVIR